MNISFEKQVALVTGAGSGLGLATAKAFADAGASVVLADWNEESVRSAAADLAAKGHEALAIRCDVANDGEVEAMVGKAIATFGRLDAAYNNAGVQNALAETGRLRPCHGDQPSRRVELHEVRAAPYVPARQRRDRQLFVAGRP